MVVDYTNSIILLNVSGETYAPPTGQKVIPVDFVMLEGSAANPSTLFDDNGNTLVVLDVLGFFVPIKRWVTGLSCTLAAGAQIRVFLKKDPW